MAARPPRFNKTVLIDTTPLPDDIPPVKEVGTSSAPLLSAAYFIGARCRAYNDDYMVCKTESNGRGELECLKEGRKNVWLTVLAMLVSLQDVTKHCLTEFREHWDCLEQNNHAFVHCRKPERTLNKCVFDKLGIEKKIPGTPEGTIPVHLRKKQIFAN